MRNVVSAIEVIPTNQQNDFLIKGEEEKIWLLKSYNDKLYTKICCQITLKTIWKIEKQSERIKIV